MIIESEHIVKTKIFSNKDDAMDWWNELATDYRKKGYAINGDPQTDPIFDWVHEEDMYMEMTDGQWEATFEADFTVIDIED